MIETRIQIEHTRLLIAFYQKAYLAAIPFSLVLCTIFLGHVEPVILLTWLGVLFIGIVSQVMLARQFTKSTLVDIEDYRRWVLYASVSTFLVGGVFGYMSILSTRLPIREFVIVKTLLMTSITIFSACGFKKLFLAYAIPLLASFSIAGYLYFDDYGYLSGLQLIVLILFYVISHYYEKTLLESIKIRFEKNALVEELKDKKDEAEQANRAKSTFLASASHDLRQPLHALGLYLDSMKALPGTAEQRLLSEKMGLSIDALNSLFDSLLDISKLDSGITQPIIEHIDLDDIVTRVRSNFESVALEKGLILSVRTNSAVVQTDPILLERIISNLLSNAIRYTPQGMVTLRVDRQTDGIMLTISDTGIGIPEHELDNVFNEFYQLDNPERDQTKGLGLGLSIVRRLCDLMQLELMVRSCEISGTTFELSLPPGDTNRISPGVTGMDSAQDLSGLNIVVIDDDQAVRDAMNRLLSRWGCKVSAFEGVRDAISNTETIGTPDLIISDYRLKNSVKGVDAIEALNATLPARVPAIIITGDTSTDRLSEASKSGHQLLHKPVNPGLLRATIAFATRTHASFIPHTQNRINAELSGQA